MDKKKMKAYMVQTYDSLFTSVEFAESAGKAKYQATQRGIFQDWCDYNERVNDYNCTTPFFEVSAHRVPELDKCYKKGKTWLQWDLPADRKALVRYGFYCNEINEEECKYCPASDICEFYQDYLKSLEE